MMNAAWRSVAVLAAAGLAAAIAGCASYASYPPVPKDTALNDPNGPAMEEVMMAGLRWIAAKYPPAAATPTGVPAGPASEVAINLPPGVKPVVYERVAAAVPGGKPVTPETQHLPTYHVSNIRIRGDEANIWIVRPVWDLGAAPGGGVVYQEVKLWLRGGLRPWHVVTSLDRTPGATQIPELVYYSPASEPTRRASQEPEGTFKPAPRATVTAPEPQPPEGDSPVEPPKP
jgi:hypothetical protein